MKTVRNYPQLFTQNTPSKAFFEKHGFREVGIRKKIGQLHGEWIDNYLFEKNFN
ncbi:MAG: N-acetyltransferase family protein [Candidatus Actinomarina sp.]